jgi:hypothetical protein
VRCMMETGTKLAYAHTALMGEFAAAIDEEYDAVHDLAEVGFRSGLCPQAQFGSVPVRDWSTWAIQVILFHNILAYNGSLGHTSIGYKYLINPIIWNIKTLEIVGFIGCEILQREKV